jgi:hypothetical protein
MKGLTKAELIADRDRLAKENVLLTKLLRCARHDKPVIRIIEREHYESGKPVPDCDYVFELYDPDAPHGGLLLTTFRHRKQRPMVHAYYYEEFVRLSNQPHHVRRAVEQLQLELHRWRLQNEALEIPAAVTVTNGQAVRS